ncbi:MAG: hypothetical protein KAS62_10630, partial [Candidatus Delongbacteria bacterium]|nr:hypothetical protein [Candidatus Delongbacteria bacterium]
KAPMMHEATTSESSDGKIYSGNTGANFDKSGNGYGWYLGYNKKVQAFFDPVYGEMYGTIYRQLNPVTGNGTIGGMIGEDEGGPDYPIFNNFAQTIYSNSIYQSVGTDPGGQYPYASDFINGYFFGIFNDVDTNIVSTSQPMFTVADATWGYIFSIWSEPKRIKYMYTNAVIPDAWMGTGDVVYDPSTLYYYWSQAWKEGQHSMDETILSCVVGRTMTPADETSWEWTDYKGLRFDANYSPVKASELEEIGDFYFSYAKDNYGNGTGKGVGVALTRNFDQNNPRLSYIYTNDWGGSFDIDSIGCGPNWTTDSGNMFQIPLNTMFDWYGETLTFNDSIGFDLATQQVIYDSATVIMDDPFIAWNISVIATAYDQVHVLIKAFPGSTEYPGVIFPWTDNGFRAGYYMVNGTISGTGVTWEPATLVANFVDNDKGWTTAEDYTGMEWRYSNRNTLSLCNLGFGQLLASWLDKPSERAVQFGYENANNKYCDDGYLIFSSDDG